LQRACAAMATRAVQADAATVADKPQTVPRGIVGLANLPVQGAALARTDGEATGQGRGQGPNLSFFSRFLLALSRTA